MQSNRLFKNYFLFPKNPLNSVPFDQKLLLGFYAVLVLHGVASSIYCLLYTGALALHSGVNIFIQAFVHDLQAIFDEIDAKVTIGEDYSKLKIYQIEATRFHDHITRQIF